MSIGVIGHVEPNGTVILPKWIRKTLGIRPGDNLVAVYLGGGKLLLAKPGAPVT